MKNITQSFALFSLLGLLATSQAQAQVTVTDPWVRATTSQQKATGAFMKLESRTAARLVGASSPVAKVVEVHEMIAEDGVMKMRATPQLLLSPGKAVELKPGSYHIMLMDLKAPISVRQKVPVTLLIENDKQQRQEQTVEAEARPLNAVAATEQHQHGKH